MLKRLKLGICSFEDVHFTTEQCKKTRVMYTEFSEAVTEHLVNSETSDGLLSKGACQKFLTSPSVVRILSDKFNLSYKHLMVITSSSHFLLTFFSDLAQYQEKQETETNEPCHVKKIAALTNKSWKIINEIFECLNYYRNLDLFQTCSELWIEVFDFMLSRCCKVKKISFTERIILPNCSFPFSWIIYLHLQQIADIKRLAGMCAHDHPNS